MNIIQKSVLKIAWGYLGKRVPWLRRYSPVVALIVLMGAAALTLLGHAAPATDLRAAADALGLTAQSPVGYDELLLLFTQGVGVILAGYGLIRLFKARMLPFVGIKRGTWQSYAPLVGEALLCATIVLDAIGNGGAAKLLLTLGDQIGVTQAAPVSGPEITAVSVELVAVIALARGIVRRLSRTFLVISEG